MLYLVGLGLGSEQDITLRGLEAVKKCKRVFLESYTSILGVDKDKLEELYGREVTLADRNCVESQSEMMMEDARDHDVAVLVVGDPFGATTHTDFYLRAVKDGIPVKVIHNASIMNAVGCCGLQLYNFGRTVSICFWSDGFRPSSFYDKIVVNHRVGLHTLCLLDIKVKEPDLQARIRGIKGKFLPPRYMSVKVALETLQAIEEEKGEGVCTLDSLCVGLARVGQHDQRIAAGTIKDVMAVDFGAPLHSLVILGETDPIEKEMLKLWWCSSEDGEDDGAGAEGGNKS